MEFSCGVNFLNACAASQEGDSLDLSNPVASRPKYRSSIHHAICLMESINWRTITIDVSYPMLKLFIHEFTLNAKSQPLEFTHCAWILASLRQRVSQLINE